MNMEESMSNSSYVPDRYSVNQRQVMNRSTTRNQIAPEFTDQSYNSQSNFSERYNVDGRFSHYKGQSGNSVNAQEGQRR